MCLANASPALLGLSRRPQGGCQRALGGGSALPSVPLPLERPFASQVPGVASLSGIKQTLPRSSARRCPCAPGIRPPLPRAPSHAGLQRDT